MSDRSNAKVRSSRKALVERAETHSPLPGRAPEAQRRKPEITRRNSVGYWWWAFLRCHDGYLATCEAEGHGEFSALYGDFGDVRDANFARWWTRSGIRLFVDHSVNSVRPIGPGRVVPDDPYRLFLEVPLASSLRVIHREFRDLVKVHWEAARKDWLKEQGMSRARYKPHAQIRPHALEVYLKAWKARQQFPGRPLYELADRLGIPAPGYGVADGYDRIVKTNEVARRLRKARRLIDNAAHGRFPCYDPIKG